MQHCASMVLAMAVSLSWHHATLFWKAIRVCPKIRVLPSGTLSQTPEFKIFATACCRKCCQLRWMLSVINWRRSSVASLSHPSFTFVYNMMDATQSGSDYAAETCYWTVYLSVSPVLLLLFWTCVMSSCLKHQILLILFWQSYCFLRSIAM